MGKDEMKRSGISFLLLTFMEEMMRYVFWFSMFDIPIARRTESCM
jgi:hypothetical protein